MKRGKLLAFLLLIAAGLFAGYWTYDSNRCPTDLTPIIVKYQGKSDKERIHFFQKDFARALKKPKNFTKPNFIRFIRIF